MVQARWRTLPVLVTVAAVLLGAAVAVAFAFSEPSKHTGRTPPESNQARTSSPVPVIVPGRPGEPASVRSSDEVTAPESTAYSTMDASFVRMMIPHHAQAVQMAALAPSRTDNPQILGLAGRIRAAQAPEIARLRAWLRSRHLTESDNPHADHGTGHASMRGMQSPAAIRELAAARGDRFDKTFVAMMSDHHQGAMDMATEALKTTRNVEVEQIAAAIATEQSIEIARMREVIDS